MRITWDGLVLGWDEFNLTWGDLLSAGGGNVIAPGRRLSKPGLIWVMVKGRRKLVTYEEAAEIATRKAKAEARRLAEVARQQAAVRAAEEAHRLKLRQAASQIVLNAIKQVKDNREW